MVTLATQPGRTTSAARTALEVRLGIVEHRTDAHERLIEVLQADSARTHAAVESLGVRLAGLETAVRSSEGRITAAVRESEERLERRLDEHHADGQAQVEIAASAARDAAEATLALTTSAMLRAREEWPRLARLVIGVLALGLLGLLIWAIVG